MITQTIQYIFENKRSIATFLTVGLLSAIVYFSSFTVLWKYLDVNYNIAVSIAYGLSILFHFNANRHFTFKSRGPKIFQHLIKYLIMTFFNYLLTLLIINIVVERFHLSPYLGIVLSIAVTMNIGYLLFRYWIFQVAVK
jgi:putative flippase GtrA